ncbi:hypothetical protein FXF61_06190 [Pseudomonas sp. C27(2019)]|uniref:hypothetical protein n=1 Tax=Pseudomonas sp. C27(2019) TaxID=2604941 RepID=UPI0012492C29|nr:hypothetical protein [Pseudomonas sp. C27(2019)]QEY58784.1 hypothetical protein FXF61_06190 [Pseudomonas sp. C27(2019)]
MRITSVFLSLALLTGCSLVERVGNKPYVFPVAGEPSAAVAVNYDKSSRFIIYNMDINGCFAGTTSAGPSGSSVDVHSDKPIFMALEQRLAGSYCNIIFSFTPEKNAKYALYQGNHLEKTAGFFGVLAGTDRYCSVSGLKQLNSVEQKQLKLQQMIIRPSGFACLKMREFKSKK